MQNGWAANVEWTVKHMARKRVMNDKALSPTDPTPFTDEQLGCGLQVGQCNVNEGLAILFVTIVLYHDKSITDNQCTESIVRNFRPICGTSLRQLAKLCGGS